MTAPVHISSDIEWRPVTCDQRDHLFWVEHQCKLKPHSTYTDPERYIYTEWAHPETEEPMLRDHRWPDGSQPCRHEVPAAPSPVTTQEPR